MLLLCGAPNLHFSVKTQSKLSLHHVRYTVEDCYGLLHRYMHLESIRALQRDINACLSVYHLHLSKRDEGSSSGCSRSMYAWMSDPCFGPSATSGKFRADSVTVTSQLGLTVDVYTSLQLYNLIYILTYFLAPHDSYTPRHIELETYCKRDSLFYQSFSYPRTSATRHCISETSTSTCLGN